MNSLAPKKVLLGLLLACLSTGFLFAQSMSFSVTTKTYNGNYKPKHVLACWISSSTNLTTSASFVRTINFQSNNGDGATARLVNWVKNSASNKTDAITGATLGSHNQATTGGISRIPFTWNFKNKNGVVVADGTYYINIEFTESNAAGQIIQYPVIKGTASYTIAPTPVAANAYFTGPSLVYTAPTVALTTTEVTNFDFVYSPSDRNLQLEYDAANHTGIELQLINLKGQTVFNKALKGFGKETTQLPACQKGIYLIRLTDKEGWSQTHKLLL